MLEYCMLASGAAISLKVLLTPPFLYYIILLLAMAAAGHIVRTPWFKGWFGELQVNLIAWLCLDSSRYHLVRNVTLPCGEGTTQIDQVVVSRYGVFVIETKNMSGWIFGREREATWTQKFRRQSNRFQNPLRQNYKHTATLVELLALAPGQVKSVVVFIGDAKLKTEMPSNVVVGSAYVDYIKSHKQEVLTSCEVDRVLELIERERLKPNLGTHLKHVKHVQETVAQKSEEGNRRP